MWVLFLLLGVYLIYYEDFIFFVLYICEKIKVLRYSFVLIRVMLSGFYNKQNGFDKINYLVL